MDAVPQGTGAIPDPHMVQAASPPTYPDPSPAPTYPYQTEPTAQVFTAPIAPPTNGKTHPVTRAQIRELRRQEREVGVPFLCKQSGFEARVKDLPFTDVTMLAGIPQDMRHTIDTALGASTNIAAELAGSISVDAMQEVAEGELALTNAICIAGFIWPHLVRTEEERLVLIGNGALEDDVWLVDDLHVKERGAYRAFVMRNRDDEEEEMARLDAFQGAGLAQAATG